MHSEMCVEVPPVRISELMQRCVAESKGKLAYNLLPESQLALATPASDDITDEFCFKYCAWSGLVLGKHSPSHVT